MMFDQVMIKSIVSSILRTLYLEVTTITVHWLSAHRITGIVHKCLYYTIMCLKVKMLHLLWLQKN